MTRRNIIWTVAGLLLLGLVGGTGAWMWKSPEWALQNVREAIAAGDAQTIDDHIDHASLKASIRDRLVRRLAGQVDAGGLDVAAQTEEIDAQLTRDAVRRIIADGLAPNDVVITRSDLTSFVAGPPAADGGAGGAVFTLEGTAWRITGVKLPNEG